MGARTCRIAHDHGERNRLNGLIVAALAYRLYRNAALAAMAAAICVTFADVLFYRGWLGYRDPLSGLLVFGAMASLWMAVLSDRVTWLGATLMLATCAFLTKGIIAYVYVGSAVLVFLWQQESRKFLLKPTSLALAVLTLCLPYVWFHWVTGDQAQGGRMASEIGDKLGWLGIGPYLWKLAAYPLETVLRLAPVSVLAVWWLRHRKTAGELWRDRAVSTMLITAGIAFIPFWLSPQSHFRYLLPILPLLALTLAVCVSSAGGQAERAAWRWLWAAVALKFVFAAVLFPVLSASRARRKLRVGRTASTTAKPRGFPCTHTMSVRQGFRLPRT
jgi:4-amino-4-deoxy-L-arabinose transferase-like glycosyltransferase